MAATTLSSADLGDIQGLVLNGWADLPHASFVFARVVDAARARRWLGAMAERVTSCRKDQRPASWRLQLAIARPGFDALGIPVHGLAQEADDGMAARARILGDDPDAFELGTAAQRFDLVILAYADSAERVDALVAEIWDDAALIEEARERSELLPEQREHFGFRDGIAQPFVAGAPSAPKPGQEVVAAGEFLLGHENAYGRLPKGPRRADTGADLGRNGSYLVLRKIEQDVAAFWRYFAARAGELSRTRAGADREQLTTLLAAKAVGRWPDGAPLVLCPEVEETLAPERLDDFGYLELDPHGERCPVAAHVRRANPRDALDGSAADSRRVVGRHRLIRRGRPYGPPLSRADVQAERDGGAASRGLYFLSLQASIARGFEFVQQTWLGNPGFAGLYREPDPLGAGGGYLSIPSQPLRLRLAGMPAFLQSRGGGYFFLPSRTALRALAS